MGVFDLFSKRQKRLRGDFPDVYTYDKIPEGLRIQIIHIWGDVLGSEEDYASKARGTWGYDLIHKTLYREYGVFQLVEEKYPPNKLADLYSFFLSQEKPEKVLDVIELSFRFIDRVAREFDFKHDMESNQKVNAVIEELNARFKEHCIGYEFRNGEIIRVDSELIHAEVVKPTLKLLAGQVYKVANDEFMQAHEHYRHRRYKDCLTWSLKSLESTMKAICDKRGWPYNQNDPAKRLVEICFDNGLIPAFWQSHFSALRATLESGIPTARNIMAGHGNGTSHSEVPPHLAAYVLHMTASTLVFLIEAEKSLV